MAIKKINKKFTYQTDRQLWYCNKVGTMQLKVLLTTLLVPQRRTCSVVPVPEI